MTLRLTVSETPTEADRDAVVAPLRAYNVGRAGDPRLRPVAVLLRDEADRPVGGLWGRCVYDWLFVELREGLGFEVFGELADHPLSYRQFFLQKRLDRNAGA